MRLGFLVRSSLPNSDSFARFQVFTATSINMAGFWDAALCSLW